MAVTPGDPRSLETPSAHFALPIDDPRNAVEWNEMSAAQCLPMGRGVGVPNYDMAELSAKIRDGTLEDAERDWLEHTALPEAPRTVVYTASDLIASGRMLAAAADTFTGDGIVRYAENTMDDASMMINQSLASDGALFRPVNLHCELVMGHGFHFELEPLVPPADGKSPRAGMGDAELDAMACLDAAGEWMGTVAGGIYPTLAEAAVQMNKQAMVFPRSAIRMHRKRPEGHRPFMWNGGEVKGVPTCLEVIHPRDMGMVGLNAFGAPARLWRNHPYNDSIDLKDTIYMHNAMEGAHVHNSAGFGLAPITGAIAAARIVSKLDDEDFPVAFRISWTGVPLIVYSMPGAHSADKARALRAVARNFVAGGPIVIGAEPESIAVHDLKMDPPVGPMMESRGGFLNYIYAVVGLPQMAVSESDTSRSTSSAKSTLVSQGSIEPRRARLGELLARGFGQPILEANWPELAKKWRVRVVFKPLDAESLAQKVEAANGVMASFPLRAEHYGDIVGIDDLEGKVDDERLNALKEAERNEGMNDRTATGGKMVKGKSQSSKKQHLTKHDEQDKR